MKILYIAKHNSGGNNDEDCITYSLRELGHTVECIQEGKRGNAPDFNPCTVDGFDFILFHKCTELAKLKRSKPPKVFWDFDLVDGTKGGEDMTHRWAIRRQEIQFRMDVSQLGFCTDGDWVDQDRSGKLVHLMQGADPRIEWMECEESPVIISTARSDKVGKRRIEFMEFMNANFTNFRQYPRDVHGAELHRLIASAMACVAPDWPGTDRYQSNRMVLTCGYGGLMVHRDWELAKAMYEDMSEFISYASMNSLLPTIRTLTGTSRVYRRAVRRAAFERTKSEHTYVHRCERLVEIVQERLL